MTDTEGPVPRRPLDTMALLVSLPLFVAFTAIYAGLLLAAAVFGARFAGMEALAPLAAMTRGGSSVAASMGPGNPQWLSFLIGVILYLGAILSLLTLASWWGGRGWRAHIAWTRWRTGSRRDVWLLTGGALVYGVLAGMALSYLDPAADSWFKLGATRIELALSFLLVVVLAPIAEELLFRGWVYTALRPRWGFGSALGATSTVFALLHWEKTHIYSLVVLPVGALLGIARERSGSVRASMTMHAIFNGCGWLATVFGVG